jgi:7-carboxy-7-deazaguanine synthase
MKISEIFKSIQGEGANQGRPCIFIRLAGCNLSCAWCDTAYARTGGLETTVEEVLDVVWRLRGDHFCITGGEPLMQSQELLTLVRKLHAHGSTVEIETNGTYDFAPFQPYATICMDVKCPSSGEKSELGLIERLNDGDVLKFVVADLRDCTYAETVLGRYPTKAEVFLSPVEGADAQEIAGFLIEHNLPARLQVQLHKVIGVP